MENDSNISIFNPIFNSFIIDTSSLNNREFIDLLDNIHKKEYVISSIPHLICHEVSFDKENEDPKQKALHYLEKNFLSKSNVEFLNFYKGMKVSTDSKFIKISDGNIFFTVEKIQGYAMKIEEKVIIQGKDLPFDISAEIKIVDLNKKIVLLKNFEPLKYSASNRKYIRVAPEHRTHLSVNSNKTTFSGNILDLSEISIAVKLNNSKNALPINSEVNLQFDIPLKRVSDIKTKIIISGKVFSIIELEEYTQMIINYTAEEPYNSFLNEYIYERQKDLSNELKFLINKLI